MSVFDVMSANVGKGVWKRVKKTKRTEELEREMNLDSFQTPSEG